MTNLLFVCNALDDKTRLERSISTDSPAATRKLLLLAKATTHAGIKTYILSLGRGRQNGSAKFFKAKVSRVEGVPFIYLPFIHFPIVSELLSLVYLPVVLIRLHKKQSSNSAVFYNRVPAYILGLLASKLLGFKSFLDLEDGETHSTRNFVKKINKKLLIGLFDNLCGAGALLACSALKENTQIKNTICCYGTVEKESISNWSSDSLNILLGGTVNQDTGSGLLIETIKALRNYSDRWVNEIHFHISGKGESINEFKRLAEISGFPRLTVHERLNNAAYLELLGGIQVGLALKPLYGKYANTTFPSKVIEFSSRGILVISTDISDVRSVLGDNAIYLSDNSIEQFIEQLRWVVANKRLAETQALGAMHSLEKSYSMHIIGKQLKSFLFNA